MGNAVFTGPVHAHATAIYLNPAALGLADRGAHLYIDGSANLDLYGIRRSELVDPQDPGAGLTEGARVDTSTMATGGTVAWYSAGENIAVGAALSWVVLDRFIEDEEALGYHTLGGAHRQYVSRQLSVLSLYDLPFDVPLPMPSLAGAYKWRDFYFGVGVSLRSSAFELSFLRDTALERGRPGIDAPCSADPAVMDPCGIENPDAAERYDVTVSTRELFTTRNLVLNGGIMWQVAPAWWLGVYYQSPPGFLSSLRLQGEARITPAPYLNREPFVAKAELIYRLPQTIAAGIRGPVFADFDFFAALRWQNLSRQRLLDFRLIDRPSGGGAPEWMTRYRGFDDTMTVSAGVEQREGGRLRLGGRVLLESETTSPRAISPLQVEGFQITGAVGAELRLLDRLVLYGSYGLTYFPTVTAGADSLFDPAAQLACVESGYELEACTPAAEGRAVPTAAGTYERMRHGVRAALRYDF